MLFDLDPSKPAEEVLFSRKKKIQIFPTMSLNNIQVEIASHHQHQSILLNEKLNSKQHIDTAILKIYKSISVIKNSDISTPQKSLITIYKAFLRSLTDYRDEPFCEKLESVQYKAALAITGAMQGNSRDKIYQELELDLLKLR